MIGYRDLAKLALAVERDLHGQPIQEVAAVSHACDDPSTGPPPKIHGAWDILFGRCLTA